MTNRFALLTCLGLTSCALPTGNLHPASLRSAPALEADRDIDYDFGTLRTFSTVAPPTADPEHSLKDKALLFFLRAQFELKGYTYVPLDRQPDFVVSGVAECTRERQFIPPSTRILPVYQPGRTMTSTTESSGRLYADFLAARYSETSTTRDRSAGRRRAWCRVGRIHGERY